MSASPTNRYQYQHGEYDQNLQEQPALLKSTGATTMTRTVAIIKTHALGHRFDIERRIQEASFEIVKERQMEFDTETDPDTLYELFGDDTDSLAEGPVWVYVLERRRAVEVWNTLMGDPDVEIARKDSPNSLRSLYGISRHQNGLMGSPDTQTAEVQIAALFVSSPPFPTTELPTEEESTGGHSNKSDSLRGISASVLRRVASATDDGYAPSSATNPSTVGGSSQLNANGKPHFRARLVPATHETPDIVPRTTKAAALRAGLLVEKTITSGPRAPISKERQAKTFANVPGHKRHSTIAVASTAAPTIAPRMTKAASLRLGLAPIEPVPLRQRSRTNEDRRAAFEGVHGHKRRETIAVASVKGPIVAPKTNKSATLRAQKESLGPPTSYMFKRPTISSSTSNGTLGPPRAPTVIRPASQASGTIAPRPLRLSIPRSTSVLGTRSPSKINSLEGGASTPPHVNGTNGVRPAARPASAASKVRPTPRPSSIGAPTIAPRLNKSAALRAAKQEAEQAAAAVTAAKKAAAKKGSVRSPPSSFKAVV